MNDMENNFLSFKSGTDIRGVASEGVAGQSINLTDDAIEKMTAGFIVWLQKASGKSADKLKVSVGHDSRISADRIKTAVIKTLTTYGIKALDCGLSSTPAMFMTTIDLSCDGAVQITASHHPFNRNGLKFFIPSGGLAGADITAILNYAAEGSFPAVVKGETEPVNYMAMYATRLRNMICKEAGSEKPLEGFKIVVDAGNGAGGFYANDVLAPLGADITGSQFLEPDGMFPNHIPNPENKEAMDSISKATVANKADLGVIFDTDVDRSSCVDSTGKEINRNRIVALAAAIALEGNEHGTIVTDSITSRGLTVFIEKDLKGLHCRFKRGYKNVIDEAVRLNNQGIPSPLAIETSGHAAFKENYFLDDGAYLMTKIIIKMVQMKKQGKKLENLIENLEEPLEETELRLKITCEDFKKCGETVIVNLFGYARENGWAIAPENHEGLRVSFGEEAGDGWFLLRMSVHDPIMPLNIESDSVGGVQKIAKALYEFLKTADEVDITPLRDFIKE